MHPVFLSDDQISFLFQRQLAVIVIGQNVNDEFFRGFDAGTVSEVFELPDNIIPVMMFAMGYPSDRSKPHPWHALREPIEHFVTEM